MATAFKDLNQSFGKGRPAIYTEELGLAVCHAIANSTKGLRGTLASDPALPALSTVELWIKNNAHFSGLYANAKSTQLRHMAEDIVDIANDDSLDPNDKRIQIDTRKWLLSKLMVRTFGDKLDVTSGGEALSTPAHMVDAQIESILMMARMRRLKGAGPMLDLPPEAVRLLD